MEAEYTQTPEKTLTQPEQEGFKTEPSEQAPLVFLTLLLKSTENPTTTHQESVDLTPEKVLEYTEIVSKEIAEIIGIIKERQQKFRGLTGRRFFTVFEFDGKCGAGKTSAHLVLKNQEKITTDDHNENPQISSVAFAPKIELAKGKKIISQRKEGGLIGEEDPILEYLENEIDQDINLKGDEGAFKLELVKWLRIYDQLIEKLETEKEKGGELTEERINELTKVYSTRGVVTLIAHTFARQVRGEIAFPQKVASWMSELLNSEAVPLPALFGYISPGDIEINQNRILQRQAERELGHTLRAQEIERAKKYQAGEIKLEEREEEYYNKIVRVFEKAEGTALYRREDQVVHKAVLEFLIEMMIDEEFLPTVLDSGNVSSESIARGIVRSSEILLNPKNSEVVGKVFRDFLEKVASGEISAEYIQRKMSQKSEEIESKKVGEVSAMEYFESQHTNDYGFVWEKFENKELNCEATDYKEDFPEEYEFFESQVVGGLDVVIPYRNGSVENLNQTLANLTESFNQLLSYLPEKERCKVKLNIIIVDQESTEPLATQDNQQGNIRTRIVQAKKHPNYDFDVDACRAEGVKYTELQNTLFLDHEVFLHPKTLTRFYKTIAKTKSAKGLEAIACCSSTVDKITQGLLNTVLQAQKLGRSIEGTTDWTADILGESYLRNLGGLLQDSYGIRPVYGFLRPGIHLLPTDVSRHAFETSSPIGGYGKEQMKYLKTFIQNNGNIFVIMDPNEETRVYTIKSKNLTGHQKTLKKEEDLRDNANFEGWVLENTRVQIFENNNVPRNETVQIPNLRYKVIKSAQ